MVERKPDILKEVKEMAFNPNDHMMKLKGKEYLQVMWRLVWFREDKPNWSLDSTVLEMDENHAVFKAVICDENGQQKSVGHGSESRRDFGDFLEKAETKAVGRALAMLGYGTQFAPDLDEGTRIVDSPVPTAKTAQEEPLPDDAMKPDEHLEPRTYDVRTDIQNYAEAHGLTSAQMHTWKTSLIKAGKLKNITYDNMTRADYEALVAAIVENYPDALRGRTA